MEVTVPSQESERSCICVSGVSIQESERSCICVSGVLTVEYVLFYILLLI